MTLGRKNPETISAAQQAKARKQVLMHRDKVNQNAGNTAVDVREYLLHQLRSERIVKEDHGRLGGELKRRRILTADIGMNSEVSQIAPRIPTQGGREFHANQFLEPGLVRENQGLASATANVNECPAGNTSNRVHKSGLIDRLIAAAFTPNQQASNNQRFESGGFNAPRHVKGIWLGEKLAAYAGKQIQGHGLAVYSLLILCLWLFPATAAATTYFISAAGADTNNGTSKVTSWLHAPGMPNCANTCASTTPTAGDNFIFRGGDTWHYQSGTPAIGGSWAWTWSGTTTNCNLDASAGAIVKTSCIYIGTDHTWFAGGSYVRPIFSEDNPIANARPATCTAGDTGTLKAINAGAQNYLIFDDFEFSGACWQGSPSGSWFSVAGTQVEISNHYFHGWMYGSSSSDDDYWAITGGMPKASYQLCDHNVFDNSDGTFGNLGATGSQGNASGASITNACKELAYNYFHQVSNGCICNPNSVHDNSFTQLFQAVPGNQHGNVVEWNSSNAATGTYILFYNNLIFNLWQGETIDIETTTGQTVWIFGNIDWGIGNSGNCYLLDAATGTQTYNFFNNTVDQSCTARSVTAGTTALVTQSNHFIGTPTNISWFTSLASLTDNGNEVFQLEATANGQGYVSGNNYAPTLITNSTVGAGANNATLCGTIPDSQAASACVKGTSSGVREVSGEGGFVVSYPGVTVNARGTWDAGAYQFSAAVVSPAPAVWILAETEQ